MLHRQITEHQPACRTIELGITQPAAPLPLGAIHINIQGTEAKGPSCRFINAVQLSITAAEGIFSSVRIGVFQQSRPGYCDFSLCPQYEFHISGQLLFKCCQVIAARSQMVAGAVGISPDRSIEAPVIRIEHIQRTFFFHRNRKVNETNLRKFPLPHTARRLRSRSDLILCRRQALHFS